MVGMYAHRIRKMYVSDLCLFQTTGVDVCVKAVHLPDTDVTVVRAMYLYIIVLQSIAYCNNTVLCGNSDK